MVQAKVKDESEVRALLVRERAELVTAAGEISATEKPSEDQRTRFDAIEERIGEIDAKMTEIDKVREWERGQAKVVEGVTVGDSPFVSKETAPYPSFGHQLRAIYDATLGDVSAREKLMSVPKYQADAQGAGIAIDSDGGFLVQTDTASEIMRRMNELGRIIGLVRRVPLSPAANGIELRGIDETSRVDGSRWGGIRGYWVEEGEAPTDTKPTFYKVPLKLKKVAALGYATDELLSEVAAMTTIFTEGFAEELLFKVEDAIFEGDGAGKPMGITSANAVVSIAKEEGQAAATIVHENLIKMWTRLHARSRASAVWFINQDVEPQLDDLAKNIGTGGVEPNYVTYDTSGVLRIKGRPVVPVEYASTLGTVGDLVLADLSQYALIDNGGVKQAQSIHVRFTTDEMAFRATYRVDGNLLWKSALTPFKGTNTQSPVLTLATRS